MKLHKHLKLSLIPFFLLVCLSKYLPNHCNICCNTLTPTVLKVLQRNRRGSGKGGPPCIQNRDIIINIVLKKPEILPWVSTRVP